MIFWNNYGTIKHGENNAYGCIFERNGSVHIFTADTV